MTPLEPSLVFVIITAAGTACTILVVIWNNGKNRGVINGQIEKLQADVTRQNGNGSDLSEKVERNLIQKVEKDDCSRVHAELSTQIKDVHGRIDDLYTQRQLSEDRILAAIKKRRPAPRARVRHDK